MKTNVLVVVSTLLIAGCLEAESSGGTLSDVPASSAPPTGTQAKQAPPTAAPSEETGSLVASVVDDEQSPIEGAEIALSETDHSAYTDPSGTAVINGISPGSFTVLVAKPGFSPEADKGRAVTIEAGEVTEVTMVLRAVQVVNATNSYHRVFPFRAFISCAIEGAPGMIVNRGTPCGQWLNPGGTQVGDPNHKSRFQWTAENLEIMGVVVDGKWQPSTAVTGQQLRFVVTHRVECGATCLWQDSTLNIGGPSPQNGKAVQGSNNALTRKWGEDPKGYPKTMYYEVGSYCQTNCVGAQLVLQQNVEMVLTAFYGANPPEEYFGIPR